MVYRRTLRREVACTGIGLHCGRPVRLRLVPAPAEHGIRFVRTDVGVEIKATLAHIGAQDHAIGFPGQQRLGDGLVEVAGLGVEAAQSVGATPHEVADEADLGGRRAGVEDVQALDAVLAGFAHPTTLRFDHVVTRRAGQRRFVDLHMHMPPGWTLQRAAALRTSVEQALMAEVPGLRATIQLLPMDVEAHFDDKAEHPL